MEIYAHYQHILLCACFCALAALSAAFVLAKVCAPLWGLLRRFCSLPRIQQALVAIVALGFIQYGATKGYVRYSEGVKASETANVIEGSTVSIYWTKDTSKVIVPDTATVYIDYRITGSTDEWGLLAQSTVAAGHWEGEVANATNYDYSVWAYYIPPEPVHTNGVWLYKTLKDRAGKYAIPLRARVEINHKAISTPRQKREEEK